MLLAVVILLLLVGLVFAFAGFLGTFPDEWEWAGIILAGAASAMGAPTVLQMIWGRPLVKTRFERHVDGERRALMVFLENPPVKHALAKRLGVRRETVQSLTIAFRIAEAGSGKIVDPVRHARIHADDDPTGAGAVRISLPPTYSVAASVMIVFWDAKENNKAVVPPDRLRPILILEPGYYIATLTLVVDGTPERVQRHFVVGQGADDLIWAN